MTALSWPPTTEAESAVWLATTTYVPDMRTPSEVARDEWLEGRAISHADASHEPMSGRESDRRADLYYERGVA